MDREQLRPRLEAFLSFNCGRDQCSFQGFEDLEQDLMSRLKFQLYQATSLSSFFRDCFGCNEPHTILFPELIASLCNAERRKRQQGCSISCVQYLPGYLNRMIYNFLITRFRKEKAGIKRREARIIENTAGTFIDETTYLQAEEFLDFFERRAGLSEKEYFAWCVSVCTRCTVFVNARRNDLNDQERRREINRLQQCYKRAKEQLAKKTSSIREYFSLEALDLFQQQLLPELCRKKFGTKHLADTCS
ncbi:MAG: hypothetical protein PHQ23_10350 [Candidatus Wallbacteria bacterium]|nr:hypothetical protein [Candidatus Wallbacteria bacterium]